MNVFVCTFNAAGPGIDFLTVVLLIFFHVTIITCGALRESTANNRTSIIRAFLVAALSLFSMLSFHFFGCFSKIALSSPQVTLNPR